MQENEKAAEAAVEKKPFKVEFGEYMNELAIYLSQFGRYIILMFLGLAVKLGNGVGALAKYIWKRSENIVTAFLKKGGYFVVILISPVVRIVHAIGQAGSDIKENKNSK